jgi:hypothetical protein
MTVTSEPTSNLVGEGAGAAAVAVAALKTSSAKAPRTFLDNPLSTSSTREDRLWSNFCPLRTTPSLLKDRSSQSESSALALDDRFSNPSPLGDLLW